MAHSSASHPRSVSSSYLISIAIIGGLFFIFGFVTWLNGSLIPFLKLACGLETDRQALLVTFAFYVSYFCLAIPSSYILRRTGFKSGMSLGLAVMAVGALLFVPAALSRSYGAFLVGLFVQGMGLALLQTASNPYISVLGPIESAARRISIMGICNKVAGALSPVILSAIVLGGANQIEGRIHSATGAQKEILLQELSQRVIAPYVVMAVVLFILAGMIRFSPLPDLDEEVESDSEATRGKTSIFQFPHLLLGALCIFVYVGVEVMAADVLPLYARSFGLSLEITKNLTACTMIAMLVGYVIGIVTIPRWLRQQTALAWSAGLGIVLSICAFAAHGWASVACVALLGLANAIMWPAIFPLAIDGLGKFTKIGSALLIMGVVGGAILPQIFSFLAERIPQQTAFLACTLPAYLYILYFAMRGHRIGREKLVELPSNSLDPGVAP